MNRSKFLAALAAGVIPLSLLPAGFIKAFANDSIVDARRNFMRIYSDEKLRNEFYFFLKNVFNLYPEDDFHNLIGQAVSIKEGDREIYLEVQSKLKEITPLFSIFKYQLPALFHQKDVMAAQSMELLGKNSQYKGYLEIGSSGRYLDYLEEKVKITGERYYADGKKPGYSITEMVDRGQIPIGASYIPFTNYETQYGCEIPRGSLDLVTIYIGFHHCPIELRTSFIASIRDTMRTGGKLVLRDHDCDTEEQKTLVALAHDVFNMGTKEPWENNEKEIRNFYSLAFIQNFVSNLGFRYEGCSLYQPGDPTKNALMLFTKI